MTRECNSGSVQRASLFVVNCEQLHTYVLTSKSVVEEHVAPSRWHGGGCSRKRSTRCVAIVPDKYLSITYDVYLT